MRIFCTRSRRPVPPQVGQGSSTTVPAPWQLRQGSLKAKPPWLRLSIPAPLHTGQVCGAVPGRAPEPWQVSHTAPPGNRTEASRPFMDWVKLMLTSALMSAPRCGARAARLWPPPAEETTEHVADPAATAAAAAAEEVPEIDIEALVSAPAAGPAAAHPRTAAGREELTCLVVLLAVGRVPEDLVGPARPL